MARTRLTGYSFFLIFILILAAALLYLTWQLREESRVSVFLSGEEEMGGERRRLVTWPFLYGKAAQAGETGREPFPPVTYLAAPVSRDAGDGDAQLAADRIKAQGIGSGVFLCDGYDLTETVHPLYRERLEKFLRVRNTGWVISYEREPAGRLILRRGGESLSLEGGTHFSGKPPEVRYGGRRASVYTWIPVYETGGDVRITSAINLHLTADGKELLRRKGLPPVIPLIVEGDGPLVRTAFFSLDIPPDTVKTGSHRIAGKEAYLSRFALFFPGSSGALYWRIYVPWLRQMMDVAAPPPGEDPLSAPPAAPRFTAAGGSFYLGGEGERGDPFFIKGVNLGPALPGTWFTQFPEDDHLYYDWFTRMGDMNLNTVRIYTLLPPSFYRAFREYNGNNPDRPLYLIQEIWPEEHPPGNDYLAEAYDREYEREIERTVDALHGKGRIAPRTGRAWGEYGADVSPWTLAYLIGRELEPDVVLETNRLNPGRVYQGKFISAPEGPAVEAWLAASCDKAVAYETERYGKSRPVGLVSWPILDRQRHPVEWNDPQLRGRPPANDKAVVDINRLSVGDSSFGGLFGAYHIYPNYPDFMNNQTSYAGYRDDQGVFRYGGYLAEFIEGHSAYPALVAEYGLSTSAATAHFNPDGYNHGGLSEEEQARGIIRMTEAIRRESYAGGLVFEWIDEWAKKTWTTEPFMIPYDRQALWHNALDPEQNYGIMAMRGVSRRGEISASSDSEGLSLKVWGSESHLYLSLDRRDGWEKGDILSVGLDTYDRSRGIFSFPAGGGDAPTGLEALLRIEPAGESGVVLLAEDYGTGSSPYGSTAREGQAFEAVEILVNRAYRGEGGRNMPPLYEKPGVLRKGPLDEAGRSFTREGNSVVMRIPWGAINVSDPSEGTVLDDRRTFAAAPERDQIRTSPSESILLYVLVQGAGGEISGRLPGPNGGEAPEYRWESWDVPVWEQGEKKSVEPLARYFAGL